MGDIDSLAGSLAGLNLDDNTSEFLIPDENVKASCGEMSEGRHHKGKSHKDDKMSGERHHKGKSKGKKKRTMGSAFLVDDSKPVVSQAQIQTVRALYEARVAAAASMKSKKNPVVSEAKIAEVESHLRSMQARRPVVSEAKIAEVEGHLRSMQAEEQARQVISEARQIRASGRTKLQAQARDARARGLLSEARFEELMAEASLSSSLMSSAPMPAKFDARDLMD